MPFSPSFSARQLKEQIESFAPPEYRKKREEFYSSLREIGTPKDTCKYGRSSYKFILQAIVVAHDLYQSELTETLTKIETKKREKESHYWKERTEIEQQLERLARNDLVRRFLRDIEFYDPDEVHCPHGRKRKRCEEIHGKLALLKELEKPPGHKYFRRRVQELLEELKKEGVDPSKHSPSDFCAPHLTDRSAKMPSIPPLKSKGGRPPKDLQNYLLETVVGCIINAGMSYKDGCWFVAEILMYCFGIIPETHDPRDNPLYILCYSLEKQWLRLHPNSQSTENQN